MDPAARIQGTAFFGVALRPEYLRRVYEAQRGDDDWVLAELLGAAALRPVGQDPFRGLFVPAASEQQAPGTRGELGADNGTGIHLPEVN